MEAELHSAVAEYRAQLASLEELLAEDPNSAEVKEVYEQLQGALSYTLAALDQEEQQQQQQGADATASADTGQQLRASADGGPDDGGPAGVDPGGGDGGGEGDEGGSGEGGGEGGAAEAQEGDIDDTNTATAAAASAARPRGGAANNTRMHPSNLYYRREPDFAALAREYDELRPHVSIDTAGRAHLDTTSWSATRALTACLLRHDFGLRWWLPEGQLVPPVPNRSNYLHWINDLLQLSAPGGSVRGLDIGCGANFIYCLLGAVLHGWNMVGVDVTQIAVQCCQQLIADNPQVAALLEVRDLSYLHPELRGPDAAVPAGSAGPGGGRRGRKRPAEGRDSGPGGEQSAAAAAAGHEGWQEGVEASRVDGAEEAEEDVGTSTAAAATAAGAAAGEEADHADEEQGILLPAFMDEDETFAFTMCNPPFFESMQEAAQNPNTAFGGTAAEMVCPGGELAFVLRMLLESEELRDRVHWFSTMLGKKSTLKAVRRELHSRHVTALRTTELAQGKTSRWAVAWSWQVDPNKAAQPLRRLDSAAVAEAVQATAAEQPRAADANADATARAARGSAPPASSSGRRQPSAGPSLAAAGVPLLPRRHISFTAAMMPYFALCRTPSPQHLFTLNTVHRARGAPRPLRDHRLRRCPMGPRLIASFALCMPAGRLQVGSLSSRTILQEVRRLLEEFGCTSLELDAAAWTVTWPLQVGPLSAATDSGAEQHQGAAPKRPREGAPEGGGSWAGNIKARLRIAQQQRGRLELVATIPNTAPDAAARAFAALMAALERGLASSAAR